MKSGRGMSKAIKLFTNAVYWHDCVDADDVKLDFKMQVLDPCEENDIILEKHRTSDLPQVLHEDYDILFFDWGGMSLGNSMMEHFCSYIIKHASDNPSRYYVMVSTFTAYAMKDILERMDKDHIPLNVFLEIKDLAKHLKANG